MSTDPTPTIARLRELHEAATALPWGDDDGNVFSRPLSDQRHAAVIAKIQGEPYDPAHLDPEPSFICTTHQRGDNFDANCAAICAAMNSHSALLAVAEAAQRVWAAHEAVGKPGAVVDTYEQAQAGKALVSALTALTQVRL